VDKLRVNSIAILKTIEISLSNLFLLIAEIPVILYKLRLNANCRGLIHQARSYQPSANYIRRIQTIYNNAKYNSQKMSSLPYIKYCRILESQIFRRIRS